MPPLIGVGAFAGLLGLAKLNELLLVGVGAFARLLGLAKLNGLPLVGAGAFTGLPGLAEPNGMLLVGAFIRILASLRLQSPVLGRLLAAADWLDVIPPVPMEGAAGAAALPGCDGAGRVGSAPADEGWWDAGPGAVVTCLWGFPEGEGTNARFVDFVVMRIRSARGSEMEKEDKVNGMSGLSQIPLDAGLVVNGAHIPEN